MMVTLPSSYEELVSRFKPEKEGFLPTSYDEIWDGLVFSLFLGPRSKSAQTVYVSEVLHNWVECKAAVKSLTDSNWSKNVLADIKLELSSISGSQGEGHKRAALKSISTVVRKGELVRTIADAHDFLSRKGISTKSMKKMENDKARQMEFVVEVSDSIFGFGIVKSVFWLYSMGIGYEVVPTNPHVRKFLRSCGYSDSAFLRDTPDLYTFAPACKRMKEVALDVSSSIDTTVTPKICQHAAWLYYACKSLIPRSMTRDLTFGTLLDFLDSNGWTPDVFDGILGDIERIDDVARDLAASL